MDNEYIEFFIEDTEEYITALSDTLFALEKDISNKSLINNIFRVAHTLKSSAAAMGFEELSEVSHKAEDIMSDIRDGKRDVSTFLIDLLFSHHLPPILPRLFLCQLESLENPKLYLLLCPLRAESFYLKNLQYLLL